MKTCIFFAEGFETCEGLIVVDMLRRAGIEIDTISMEESPDVLSSQKVIVKADRMYKDCDLGTYDVMILPGGKLGTANLEADEELKKIVKNHYESGKLTCAICAAPSIFGHMGMLEGKKYTCFPSFDEACFNGSYQMELAVRDGNLITGRGMGATIEFARQIIMAVADEETLKKVEEGMQYEHSFRNAG